VTQETFLGGGSEGGGGPASFLGDAKNNAKGMIMILVTRESKKKNEKKQATRVRPYRYLERGEKNEKKGSAQERAASKTEIVTGVLAFGGRRP